MTVAGKWARAVELWWLLVVQLMVRGLWLLLLATTSCEVVIGWCCQWFGSGELRLELVCLFVFFMQVGEVENERCVKWFGSVRVVGVGLLVVLVCRFKSASVCCAMGCGCVSSVCGGLV